MTRGQYISRFCGQWRHGRRPLFIFAKATSLRFCMLLGCCAVLSAAQENLSSVGQPLNVTVASPPDTTTSTTLAPVINTTSPLLPDGQPGLSFLPPQPNEQRDTKSGPPVEQSQPLSAAADALEVPPSVELSEITVLNKTETTSTASTIPRAPPSTTAPPVLSRIINLDAFTFSTPLVTTTTTAKPVAPLQFNSVEITQTNISIVRSSSEAPITSASNNSISSEILANSTAIIDGSDVVSRPIRSDMVTNSSLVLGVENKTVMVGSPPITTAPSTTSTTTTMATTMASTSTSTTPASTTAGVLSGADVMNSANFEQLSSGSTTTTTEATPLQQRPINLRTFPRAMEHAPPPPFDLTKQPFPVKPLGTNQTSLQESKKTVPNYDGISLASDTDVNKLNPPMLELVRNLSPKGEVSLVNNSADGQSVPVESILTHGGSGEEQSVILHETADLTATKRSNESKAAREPRISPVTETMMPMEPQITTTLAAVAQPPASSTLPPKSVRAEIITSTTMAPSVMSMQQPQPTMREAKTVFPTDNYIGSPLSPMIHGLNQNKSSDTFVVINRDSNGFANSTPATDRNYNMFPHNNNNNMLDLNGQSVMMMPAYPQPPQFYSGPTFATSVQQQQPSTFDAGLLFGTSSPPPLSPSALSNLFHRQFSQQISNFTMPNNFALHFAGPPSVDASYNNNFGLPTSSPPPSLDNFVSYATSTSSNSGEDVSAVQSPVSPIVIQDHQHQLPSVYINMDAHHELPTVLESTSFEPTSQPPPSPAVAASTTSVSIDEQQQAMLPSWLRNRHASHNTTAIYSASHQTETKPVVEDIQPASQLYQAQPLTTADSVTQQIPSEFVIDNDANAALSKPINITELLQQQSAYSNNLNQPVVLNAAGNDYSTQNAVSIPSFYPQHESTTLHSVQQVSVIHPNTTTNTSNKPSTPANMSLDYYYDLTTQNAPAVLIDGSQIAGESENRNISITTTSAPPPFTYEGQEFPVNATTTASPSFLPHYIDYILKTPPRINSGNGGALSRSYAVGFPDEFANETTMTTTQASAAVTVTQPSGVWTMTNLHHNLNDSHTLTTTTTTVTPAEMQHFLIRKSFAQLTPDETSGVVTVVLSPTVAIDEAGENAALRRIATFIMQRIFVGKTPEEIDTKTRFVVVKTIFPQTHATAAVGHDGDRVKRQVIRLQQPPQQQNAEVSFFIRLLDPSIWNVEGSTQHTLQAAPVMQIIQQLSTDFPAETGFRIEKLDALPRTTTTGATTTTTTTPLPITTTDLFLVPVAEFFVTTTTTTDAPPVVIDLTGGLGRTEVETTTASIVTTEFVQIPSKIASEPLPIEIPVQSTTIADVDRTDFVAVEPELIKEHHQNNNDTLLTGGGGFWSGIVGADFFDRYQTLLIVALACGFILLIFLITLALLGLCSPVPVGSQLLASSSVRVEEGLTKETMVIGESSVSSTGRFRRRIAFDTTNDVSGGGAHKTGIDNPLSDDIILKDEPKTSAAAAAFGIGGGRGSLIAKQLSHAARMPPMQEVRSPATAAGGSGSPTTVTSDDEWLTPIIAIVNAGSPPLSGQTLLSSSGTSPQASLQKNVVVQKTTESAFVDKQHGKLGPADSGHSSSSNSSSRDNDSLEEDTRL